MVTKFKAILRNATKKGSKVILVTARADMDDRDLFLKTFEANGYPLDNVYIERAGNLGLDSSGNGNNFTASGLGTNHQFKETPTWLAS